MLIVRLATRNLFRQAKRNVLSMVSIIFGVFIIIIGSGFALGLNENAIRAQIDSVSGHVLVLPEEYPTSGFRHPVSNAFSIDQDTQTWLNENTKAWTSRIVATPRAIKGYESMRVRLMGMSDNDEQVFPRDMWNIEGALPQKGNDQILVATKPAQLLGLKLGDVLTLESRTVDGAMNAMRYEVSGIVSTGNPMFDNLGVFMPIDTADTLIAANGRVTHVASLVNDRDQNQTFASNVQSKMQKNVVRTWQEETKELVEIGYLRTKMFNIMGFALLLMAATGIANTVLMAAFERVAEIGTLRSMGLKKSGVLLMFAVEGLWLGIFGGLIGVVSAGSICAHYSQNGIDMMALIEGKTDQMGNIPISAILYMDFSYDTITFAFTAAVITSVLASIYPAYAASKISPSQAVRPR